MVSSDLHIVVIEPSVIIREGILHLLSKSGHFTRVSSIGSPENLVSIHHPELVIINPQLVQNQLKQFQLLQKDLHETRWIALVSTLFEPGLLSHFDAVLSVHDTEQTLHDTLENLRLNREETREEEVLSERETDVLRLLVSGLSNKEIADKLNISTHTVISHRKNISQKTGIKSLSGLTIYAVVQNIISLKQAQ